MAQLWTRFPTNRATSWALRLGNRSTRPTGISWTQTVGSGWRILVRVRQRLLFASTGAKNPKASDVLYINALAAPNTINTIPEKTLLAFGDHGSVTGTVPRDGGDCERVLAGFRSAGIDLDRLAADLQSKGAQAFNQSWSKL